MTSAGKDKGYKCRKCGAHEKDPEVQESPRTLSAGWYKVPPTARRHLAKPLCRGAPEHPLPVRVLEECPPSEW